LYWSKIAAAKGIPHGCLLSLSWSHPPDSSKSNLLLGDAFYYGEGVTLDFELAAQYYLRASTLQNSQVQPNPGSLTHDLRLLSTWAICINMGLVCHKIFTLPSASMMLRPNKVETHIILFKLPSQASMSKPSSPSLVRDLLTRLSVQADYSDYQINLL